MSFLLWTLPVLMAFALTPWIINSFPGRRSLVGSFLALSLFIGYFLSWLGIWQAVPATVVSLIWLLAMLVPMGWRLVRGTAAPANQKACRPYSGILFTLLLVVAIAPIYSAPVHNLPEPDGPYDVGMKEFVVVDPTRPGLRGVAADTPRKILVRAYYPAGNIDGLMPRPYLWPHEAKIRAEAMAALGQPGFMDSYKKFVATNTYEDAPIADGKFPMVLFSHGFTGPMAENSFIVENMVSRGHVVFMASHPGNTRAVIYPDGSYKTIDKSIAEAMQIAFAKAKARAKAMAGGAPTYASLDEYWDSGGPFLAMELPTFSDAKVIWRDDMLAIADALFAQEMGPEIAPIWQAVDSSKFAYVGMSFGGSTAVTTCEVDPRCSLAISLDGPNFDRSLVNKAVRMPVLSLQASAGMPGSDFLADIGLGSGVDLSYEPIAQAGQTGLVTRVTIRDTKHLSFTDNASFWRGPIRAVFMVGALPEAETNAAINGLVGAYLDEHFQGKTGAVADLVAADDNAYTYSLDAVAQWARDKGL